MRPSIGARIAVYASCRRAASTIASLALPAARALSMVASAARAAAWALSMAARSARTVASSDEKLVRTWSYCSRAISPRSMSVRYRSSWTRALSICVTSRSRFARACATSAWRCPRAASA